MKLAKLWGTCLVAGGAVAAHGQTTLNAAGGRTTASGVVHEWSVGEMPLVQTFSASTITVTQGVLQPADPALGISPPSFPATQLQVYPNPAADHLFLKHNFAHPGTLRCLLQDVTGKAVLQERYELAAGSGSQQLRLQGLAAGSYLLQVSFTDRSRTESAAVYTIQKTN